MRRHNKINDNKNVNNNKKKQKSTEFHHFVPSPRPPQDSPEERTIIQSSDGSRKDRLKKGEEFSADEQQGIATSFRSRTALAAHIQSIGCATMTGRGPPTGRWRWHLALRYFFGFYIYISNFPHKWQAIRRLS